MPNWCTNTLTITGDKSAIEGFMLNWIPRTFNSLVPMPEDEETQKAESEDSYLRTFDLHMGSDTPEWYHWRIHNWGTKWDIDEESLQLSIDEEEAVVFEFDTAWSPPIPFVEKVARKFPALQFLIEYYELGNDFAGYARFCRGFLNEEQEGCPADFDFSNFEEELD